MKFSLISILSGAFMLAAVFANAQQELPAKAKKLFIKAEDLHSHFDYYNAIDYYKRVLEVQPGHNESMLKIADSYFKIKEYDQTLLWYDSCVAMFRLPAEHELPYANVLMNHGKNDKAIIWLKKYLVTHPNDKRANEKLNGLEDTDQFFKDYRLYTVAGFPYNSAAPDFSPTYYKDGLIFVSSRVDTKTKGSEAYLDFYYVDNIKDTSVREPVKLKGMNYRFHEGPLTIFDNGKKMIFTRNDYVKKGGVSGNTTVHFQMFYTECNDNMEWSTPTLLSIHDKQYSMGHPTVTEDGKTLYFASNIPGGHGGSDIYRSRWENNTWGKPVNLGPEINTEADEMFPFVLNDSILYFSSDGLRGLGGLDIFKCNLNDPIRVENIGYPVNSTKDDFGFVLNKNGSTGYFSSNREGGVGNDDIYAFTVQTTPPQEEMLTARIVKEEDQTPLSKANVKIISFVKPDVDLIANDAGLVKFYLPAGSSYIVIGSKEDYIGMYANTTLKDEEKANIIHPVLTNNGHKNQIAVVGRVLNKRGQLIPQATGTVVDKITGEKVTAQFKDGLVSFLGNKGRAYTVSATENDYVPNSALVSVPSTATDVQKIQITLDDNASSFTLAARVFKQVDNTVLSQAHVTIISFAESDTEVTANAEGIAEFKLPVGSPYVIIGSKDGFTGMYAGKVSPGENKSTIQYPVATSSDADNLVPVVGRILNSKKELLPNANAVVIDRETGEHVMTEVKDGLVSFYADKGKAYILKADEKDHLPKTIQLSIASTATGVEKISIVLEDKVTNNLAARVFKQSDKSPLSGAHVTIISFTETDAELTANADGIAEFSLPVASPYVIIGGKDSYIGMYAGTVLSGENSSTIQYPVAVSSDHENQVPIVGRILNKKSELLLHANATVVDNATGQKMPAEVKDGLVTFYADKGKSYTVTADEKDYQTSKVQVSISSTATVVEKISIVLEDKVAVILAARVFKESDKSPLHEAHVTIISFAEADMNLVANADGVVEFSLPVGASYIIIANKDVYSGMYANTVLEGENKTNIIYPVSTASGHESQIPVVGRILNKKSELLLHATGTVTDNATGETIPAEIKDGLLTFYGEKGKVYRIAADEKDHQPTVVQVSISSGATGIEKVSIMLDEKVAFNLAARVFKESDRSSLGGAHVSIISFAEADLEVNANGEGVAAFNLPVGAPYVLIGSKDEYIGMYAGTVLQGENSSTITYPIATSNGHDNQIPVVGRILNKKGELLMHASGTVTDKATDKKIAFQLKDGLLTFYGDKGSEYTITADDKDHLPALVQVAIPATATGVEKISIMLDDRSSFAYTISAHVIKEVDQSAVPEARVTVISFAEADMELTADASGIVNFDLPVGTSYLIIGNKDDYTGIHVGAVKEGQDKLSVVSVPVNNTAAKQLPIIGLVMDNARTPLPQAQAEVIDSATGQPLSIKNENGILYFFGNKDGKYTVTVTASNYDTLKKNFDVNSFQSLVPTIEFRLNPLRNSADASVIVFNDVEFFKIYFTTAESNSEIVEKDDRLYLVNEQGRKALGIGSLFELKKDPIKVLSRFGLTASRVVDIQGIFFDYNKAVLNDAHKLELDKMAAVLQHYPFLKLYIGTNADGRGDDNYNLNLSIRRSNAIKDYLTSHKIDDTHLIVKSYGESAPIVQCTTCTEQDHQKNRRAEFSLSAMQAVATAILPTAEATLVKKADVRRTPVGTTYIEALERYGDKQLDGFVFKVGIGAYRLNHSLTFTELNDLGTIEKKLIGGIMYYYVSDFVTFRSAENARLAVITRGVKDAYVTFFYKDKKVSFSKFVALND